MIWWLNCPSAVVGDEDVCEDEEFSGDGDEGLLGFFTVVSQAPIEVTQCGIAPGSGEGGEVEDIAHTLSSAPDAPVAAAFATVVGDGGEAGEQGNLLVRGGAELGQAGDEQERTDGADTGDGGEDFPAPGERWIAGDMASDLGLEALDILGQSGDAPLEVTAQEGALGCGALVLQGGQLGDGAEAGAHEFLEELEDLGCWRPFVWVHDGGEHGQHAGIQGVGLGQDAVGLGEHSHPVGIGDGDGDARGIEAAVQGPVPFTGGLEDNQGHGEALEPALERADALGCVGDAPGGVVGQHVDIQPVLANVDTDARVCVGLTFGHFLALYTGHVPYHLFRTETEGRMDLAPPQSLRLKGRRSHPPASGPAAAGPDAPLIISQ